ncbi:LDL receptor repeat-containing protein egg-2-like [Saccoglossus kowalevskii]|uniref:Low-density lipoprotein receptor-related protein-like n=1 Tax=Saccoglossus kowalevskii TaxID=10224 RepID=A0ABM0H1V1_SACKO|nr:PREDICTED: low-density lipoprotein receptor-related protein-like [Saccoglossus kowalevskii]
MKSILCAVVILYITLVSCTIPDIYMTCEKYESKGLSQFLGEPFRCTNFKDPLRECLEPRLVCDSRVDCEDGSDEDAIICKAEHQEYCAEGFENKAINGWKCADDMCVEECRLCNGVKDCVDGSDELDCTKINLDNCTMYHVSPQRGVILD